jgi:hypothetical protein
MNADTETVADNEKALAEVFKALHAKIRVIKERRGISIAEAIQRYGGPGIEREYRRVVQEMNAEIEAGA